MRKFRCSLSAVAELIRTNTSRLAYASFLRGSLYSSPDNGTTSDEIPVVHRLAIVYLLLPVAIWLVGVAPMVAGHTGFSTTGACVVAGAIRLVEGIASPSHGLAPVHCAGMGDGDGGWWCI